MDQPPLKRHSRHLIGLLRRHLRPRPPRTGAEVGVWRGRNSAALLAAFPDLTLTMVDAWKAEGWSDDPQLGELPQAEFDAARAEAVEVTEFAADRRIILPGWSQQAAELVADDSMDFVFIDADHRYDAVARDLNLWWPKVRPGGIFCGHDYREKWGCGVVQAVNERFGADKIGVKAKAMIWWIKKE